MRLSKYGMFYLPLFNSPVPAFKFTGQKPISFIRLSRCRFLAAAFCFSLRASLARCMMLVWSRFMIWPIAGYDKPCFRKNLTISLRHSTRLAWRRCEIISFHVRKWLCRILLICFCMFWPLDPVLAVFGYHVQRSVSFRGLDPFPFPVFNRFSFPAFNPI